jgi:hypothetical protein
MAMTPQIFSLSALAVELNLNPRTVASALRDVPADGEVGGRHPGWRLLTALRAIGATVPIVGHPLNRGKTKGGGDGASYLKERAALTKEKTKLARLERRRREGELVEATEVLNVWTTLVTTMKTRLLAMPDKMVARCRDLEAAIEAAARSISEGEPKGGIVCLVELPTPAWLMSPGRPPVTLMVAGGGRPTETLRRVSHRSRHSVLRAARRLAACA